MFYPQFKLHYDNYVKIFFKEAIRSGSLQQKPVPPRLPMDIAAFLKIKKEEYAAFQSPEQEVYTRLSEYSQRGNYPFYLVDLEFVAHLFLLTMKKK